MDEMKRRVAMAKELADLKAQRFRQIGNMAAKHINWLNKASDRL